MPRRTAPGSASHRAHQVANLVFDFKGRTDGFGDLAAQELAKTAPQPIDGHARSYLGEADTGAEFPIRELFMVANEIVPKRHEQVFLVAAPGLSAQGREHSAKDSQCPTAVEDGLRCRVVAGLLKVLAFGLLKLKAERRRGTAPFLRLVMVTRIRRVVLERCQEKRSEPTSIRVGGLHALL